MKRILIALLVMMTIFSLANAQKQTTIVNDSTGNVKVTVTKGKGKDAKVNVGNTAVTVIGIDDEDADTTSVDTGKVSSSSRGSHGKASFTISSDDDDFPFNNFGDAVGGGILVAIISIIAIFGMPVFIIFVVFFFRYKNRKARYRLAEQALAAGQPLPEEFIREHKSTDQRTQGIKNTFTGIGLFIFLWAITGEFRNWRYRTARHVYGTGTMADRLQATCQRGNQEQRNRHQKQRHHHLGEERRREERRK